MGTRNLTAVYLDGEYRIAQYGQWDGYPEGQGMTALNFLRSMDEEKFKSALRNSSFISGDELTALWKQYGADDKEENGYSGVRLVAEWSIDELPSDEDFLAAFKEDDEE